VTRLHHAFPLLAILALALLRIGLADGLRDRGDGGGGPAREAPVDPLPPPTDEALALLGGLEPGDRLGPATVHRIAGPHGGRITVVLEHGEARVPLWVARRLSQRHRAPRSTQHYDLFFGAAYPAGAEVPQAVVSAALGALTRIVASHEGDVPPPTGM